MQTVPVTPVDRGHLPGSVHPGRRLAIASVLMLPVGLPVFYFAAFFAGTALQEALGLAEGEMLREAGAWGVIAGAFLILLIAVPQIVGIVLGVKARRLGEHRLGTAGVVVNAAIGAFLLSASVFNLAFA